MFKKDRGIYLILIKKMLCDYFTFIEIY